MATATLDGTVIARSDATVIVEGNHYFPPESISWEHFAEIDKSTFCPWKGTASYYDVTVGDTTLDGVAWTYHDPKDKAAEIRDHVAFYPQVTVSDD
jgi:uncharacterized protein (DUF427 family)